MWKKKGRLFAPQGQREWLASHAAVPIADRLEGDRYRIYFTARDQFNRSHLGFFEIELGRPHKLLRLSSRPALAPGPLGSFDEDGAMACWLITQGSRKFLYYQGWNRAVSVPFRNSIGLAISEDGGETFQRHGDGPILDRSIYDPCFTATPCVRIEEQGWRMWYARCLRWVSTPDEPKPYYTIAHALSEDGVNWRRDGALCIPFRGDHENAICRPSVIKDRSDYKMWYAFRGASYRIGYAESNDGLDWVRKDESAGIAPSASGWDSEMIEYPFVFDHGGRRWMLYNGNGYGLTGIGLAVQESP